MTSDADARPATGPKRMQLDARRFGEVLVWTPSGRIDQSSADTFRTAVAGGISRCTEGGDRVVLDLRRVEYISSAGLRVLMLLAKQAKSQGGIFAVAGPQPLVMEIFEISKFTLVFRIFPSTRDALVAVAPEAVQLFDTQEP